MCENFFVCEGWCSVCVLGFVFVSDYCFWFCFLLVWGIFNVV